MTSSPIPIRAGLLRPSRLLLGAFVLTLVALPVSDLVNDAARQQRPAVLELFGGTPSSTSLSHVTSNVERASRWSEWARATWSPLSDRLLRRGSSQVLHGESGWLFLRDGIRATAAPSVEGERTPLSAILDTQRQLDAADIQLVLLPVPTKTQVHPERIGRTAARVLERPELTALRQAGIDVLDPGPLLQQVAREDGAAFLSRDTHWTPPAMQAVAERLADHVRSRLPELERLGPFDARHYQLERAGDLDALLHGERPRASMRFVIEQILTTLDRVAPLSTTSPVLLLGDSLTSIYSDASLDMGTSAGLAEHLAAALEAPVDVIAAPGAGATISRRTLALLPGRLAGKKLVVWQFSQRDLTHSPTGWTKVDLSAALRSAPTSTESDSIRTTGKLVATTGVAPPFLYDSCLIMTRYETLDPAPREVTVAYWGWRDARPSEAARYRVGDIHDLDLVSLPPSLPLDSTCWTSEIALTSAPYWNRAVDSHP